ncbi:MAG: family transposase [Hydrocarboniphaga sp.]|nr:family transposase [Hydrocarboniphaga sp.]
MAQTLSADASCQQAVNRHSVERLANGLSACSTHTGAYCKARQRLPLMMIQSLVQGTGQLISESASATWLWQGRPVKLVDGTTVTMPDTPENQARYPQQRNQKAGLGFPIARLVALLCMATGAVLDIAMGAYAGKTGSEHALFQSLMGRIAAGDLILADRYYCAYCMIALLRAQGADVLFQQHATRITDFRKGQRLGAKDHVVVWYKPKRRPEWLPQASYDALPETQSIREVKVRSKVLVTTILSDTEAPRQALDDLYGQRWNVELDLRNIKTTLGLETLHCNTPQMNEKELLVGLLAYNLIRLLMARSACYADVLPRQLSFKHTVQLWLAWSHSGPPGEAQIDSLLGLIAQLRVGHRPGRVEPRAVKRRPKPFPLLTKNRNQAREEIRRYGHPKKLK